MRALPCLLLAWVVYVQAGPLAQLGVENEANPSVLQPAGEDCVACKTELVSTEPAEQTHLSQIHDSDRSTTHCGCPIDGPIDLPEFQGFLSYRVRTERDTAEKLAFRLEAHDWAKSHNFSVWWDGKDIEDGEKWKTAFCDGIAESDYFIPLVSKKGYDSIKSLKPGQTDNVLTELETAVSFLDKNPSFIIPVCVSELRSVGGETLLAKFMDFDVTAYPDIFSTTCSQRTIRETMRRLFEIQCIPLDPEDMSCGVNRILAKIQRNVKTSPKAVTAMASQSPELISPQSVHSETLQFSVVGTDLAESLSAAKVEDPVDLDEIRHVISTVSRALEARAEQSGAGKSIAPPTQPEQKATETPLQSSSTEPKGEAQPETNVKAVTTESAPAPAATATESSPEQTAAETDAQTRHRHAFSAVRPPRHRHSKKL